ncbi:MAG: TolC family protein [Dysgonamonadaceae bacterium]|nr:TolC family protein [Dysgonamonadaceae bacterium]
MLDYKSFIDLVKEKNLNYAAEQLNVSIAEAELQAAKIFNDPQLSLEYGDNEIANRNEDSKQMGRSVSVELSKTFTVGKRGANINLARSEKELSEALLSDYFRNLLAEATLAYVDMLKQAELYRVRENSCANIRALAEADSIRLAHGDINEADAMQSRIEAESAANDLLQARTDLANACASLAVWTGSFVTEPAAMPSERLKSVRREFEADFLLQSALANRADLAAALKNSEVAARQLKVAQRERNTDFDLALGYNYNTEVKNEIAPAPRFNGVTVGISVPLKFSNLNKGAVNAAKLRRQQAETEYRQAEIEVQTQVMNALRQYRSSVEQVNAYENGLHRKAEEVLKARIYSYQRGETSRSEVLIAQQTFDDLQSAYIEKVADNVAALVDLERNVGIWNIENSLFHPAHN